MSKIKLLVEIDEEDYGDFCDWFESVPSSVDGLPCVKGKFNTALYDAKPYNPTGELSEGDKRSLEVLKDDFKERYKRAEEWIAKAKDEEIKIRAEATRDFIAEVILTIDKYLKGGTE